MSYSTNVPTPTLGPVGFVVPPESAIFTGVQTDYVGALGANLNPSLTTPQGQLETTTTAIISDAYGQQVALFNGVDPAYASGRMQDAICRIYNLSRNPAQPTALQVACGGLSGVVIPVGALIGDPNGNVYSCTAQGTIGSSGTVTLGFANQVTGPTPVPVSVSIYQAIPSWNTVAIVSGVPGNAVEGHAALELRRQATLMANSQGVLDAIYGAVLRVPGVLDAYRFENPTGSPVTIGNVTLAANSLYIAAYGGDANAIAQAIWSRKNPGCAYNGNTSVVVQDNNPAYGPPFPSYTVTFQIPTPRATCFNVTLTNNLQVPSTVVTLVQNAIIAGFTGADGGSRAGIGATIYSSRYYSDVAALGNWAQIVSIEVGTDDEPATTFTASIATTTLNVTALATGTLAPGMFVFGMNVSAGSIILSQISGTTGGIGTYALAASQTVGSEAMSAVAAVSNTVTLDIDDVPTLAAADVNVILV